MKSTKLSRRGFLKMSSVGALALTATPPGIFPPQDKEFLPAPIGRGRITTSAIYVYSQPDFNSPRLGMLKRDELITVNAEVNSSYGPAYNRRWYELTDGFIHSAYVQRVEHAYENTGTLKNIPERGRLGEITVPYADSLRRIRPDQWQPLYRLYYQSIYWITGMDEGPDGEPWYRLTDDLLHAHFYIPATYIRPITAEEITPLSLYTPGDDKRIEISLAEQTLTAYEGSWPVLHTQISTGIPTKGPSPNGIPTDTPSGRFYVQTKMPSRHMGDGELTSDIEAYELLGVPWVCFFHKDGYALHGTYWHNNFGRKMSHGCVNLRSSDALWLYRWTTPVAGHRDWYRRGMGTRIDIV
jgi:hypothetical protein